VGEISNKSLLQKVFGTTCEKIIKQDNTELFMPKAQFGKFFDFCLLSGHHQIQDLRNQENFCDIN